MSQIIEQINPRKIEQVAGSGNKFCHISDELSEYYLNLVPGFKFWDMCASEAIIKSRFGIISDAHSRPIQYDSQ